MNSFFLDASALSKRYCAEIGSDRIDHPFSRGGPNRLSCLALGTAEVVSVLVRRRNGGRISAGTFQTAMLNLKAEVIDSSGFQKLEVHNTLTSTAIPLIVTHSVNATDAMVLQCAILLLTDLRTTGNDCVLIASDQRLLRAGQAEGLITFDPETQTQADLDEFIGS